MKRLHIPSPRSNGVRSDKYKGDLRTLYFYYVEMNNTEEFVNGFCEDIRNELTDKQ